MSANVFDQFDEAQQAQQGAPSGNIFDQFDAPANEPVGRANIFDQFDTAGSESVDDGAMAAKTQGDDAWSDIASSDAFQSADWQTRQRMRADYFDKEVRPKVPADKLNDAKSEFFNRTQADVFGERDAPSNALNFGYAGGLADQRALKGRNERQPERNAQNSAAGETDQGSVLTDFGNLLVMGADRAALNVREAVRKTFGEDVVKAIDRVDEWANGKESEALLTGRIERNEEDLTQETREARQKAWINEGEDGYSLGPAWGDWRSYAAGMTESIPETAMTMAPAMALSKGVYAWNVARGVAPKLAAKRAATTATLAGGLSEGMLGGAASSREVRDSILGMPEDQLADSQAVQTLMNEGGMSFEEARSKLADDASSQAFVTSAVITGAFGGMGDRALAKIITGGSTTRLGAAVRGGIGEGIFEEMPQEAGQQLSENLAMQSADPSVEALAGVPNAAAGGLAIGAGMGAGIGAAAGGGSSDPQPTDTTEGAATPTAPEPGVTESARTAAELIGSPRSALPSSEREARDSLLYGDGFKSLRATAKARGDAQAVAELDALSEEASDLLGEETLARTRGDEQAMGAVRERLADVAQRFTGATGRINGQQGENQQQDGQAAWEQAWRDHGMENPNENLPDTTIDIAPGRPEVRDGNAEGRLTEVSVEQARQVAAAQGGDVLAQTVAGQQAEQTAQSSARQATTVSPEQKGVLADQLTYLLDTATAESDRLSQLSREVGVETGERQKRLKAVLNRAEAALDQGKTEQAQRLLQRADTVTANLQRDLQAVSVAPLPESQQGVVERSGEEGVPQSPLGQEPAQREAAYLPSNEPAEAQRREAPIFEDAAPGGVAGSNRVSVPEGETQAPEGGQEARLSYRSNGQPFATQPSAMMSGIARRGQSQGQTVEAVPVEGGFAVRVGGVADAMATDTTPVNSQAAQDLQYRTNGDPFPSERAAMASGFARNAQRSNQPVTAVPVEGGFALDLNGSTPPASQESAQSETSELRALQYRSNGRAFATPREAMMSRFAKDAERNSQTVRPVRVEGGFALNITRGDPPAQQVAPGANTAGQEAQVQEVTQLRGEPIDSEWTAFSSGSGTRRIPRAEMPQIKAEHRGALANFLSARGINSAEDTVPALSLRPTQQEFSEQRVQAAKGREGGDRAILVSADGHVVDGHHQWLAKADQGEDVRVIRLDAPINDVLEAAREFPSSEADNSTPLRDTTIEQEGDPQAGEEADIERARRAQTDTEVDSFTPSGSDRPADVATTGGQDDLLGAQSTQDDAADTSNGRVEQSAEGQNRESQQGPQFAFAGEGAATADARALGSAQERIERGDDPETVRQETGWFRGPDERWRFEINDSGARYLPVANGTAGELWTESLDRVIDHPALFAAYPGLRSLDVVSARGMGERRGQFSASNSEIILNAERSPLDQFSTLLHEIQHGIQHLEGFATGGDPSSYRLPPLKEKWLKDRVHALGRQSGENAAKLKEQYRAGDLTLDQVQQGIRQYADKIGLNELRRQLREGDERGAYRYYQRLAGEVEARNTQARQGMTAEERDATSPLDTADVPPSEVVVVYNGRALEQAPPPANAEPAPPPNSAPYVSDVAQRLSEHPALAAVRAVQSVTELPSHVLTAMEERGIDAGKVAGVYDPTSGESFVVADNLMDDQEGVRRAVHEAVAHQGIRGVLGKDLNKVMMEVYRSYLGSEASRQTLREVREAYPFLDTTTREGRLEVAEELVARVVEEANGRSELRERVMAAIRRALRTVFPGVAWTDADVRALGDRARRYMEVRQSIQKNGPSNPAETLGLKSVVRGDSAAAGVKVDEARSAVDEFIRDYNGNLPLEVRVGATQEELYGPQATVERVGRLKGAYHPSRDVMTVVASNATNKRDIQRTLRHEVLGHYGLNTFTQREKRALLDRILETQNVRSMAKVWEEVRRNYADAPLDIQAEEVFAHIAEVERGTLGKAWDRVLSALQRTLRRRGLIKHPLSHNELHDLARRIGEGIREGRRPQRIFPENDQSQFSREAAGDVEGIRFSLKSEQPESVAGPYGPNDSTGFSLPDESLLDVALRRGADKMRPLLRLRRAIQQAGGNIEEEADPYLNEELYHGRLENDLDALRNEYVEPLAQGLAKAKISQADLDEYVYALHAPERNAVVAARNPNDDSLQDGGSGMSNAEAADIIKKVERSGKKSDYQRLAKIVQDITAVRRDAIRDGGLETDDVLDAWEATYENYVPLKGFANDEPEAPRIGKGFQITGKESFLVKGRRDRAASPSTQAIVDANLALIRRRKNEVGNAFLSMVTDHPNPALWEVFTDDSPDSETSTVRVSDPETGEKRWEVRERPVQMGRDDRYFKTKRAGRTFYIKVKDQRLLNAMRNVGPESNGWLTRTAGAATRVMSSLVTSLNPEFLVTNFERDIQTALLNIGAEQTRDDGKIKGQRILWDTARDVRPAMRAAWRGLNRSEASRNPQVKEWDQWFKEFIEDGAKTGYFDMKDIDAQAKEIAAMVRRADGTTMGHMRRFGRKTADLVENVNGAVENAVRLSSYANARRNGLSRRQAASLAKNLTVNFNRRGEIGTALNAAYMFANASIQGSMNFARVMVTLKDTPKGNSPLNVWSRMNLGQKIGMGMASGAFALALLNRWLSDEDDDGVLFYDKIPDHVKERHYVLMTGWATGNPEDYIKIPLPYGYNVFAVAGTHAESVMAGTESPVEAAKNLGLAVVGSFSPIGWEDSESLSGITVKNLTPTLARSLTQLGWNEDFAARPIYQENLPFGAPKPESSLSFRSTPEAYKTLTRVLNDITGGTENISGKVDINPDVIQHLVNYYGGGAWGFAEKTADFAVRSVTGQEIENYRIPFAGRVVSNVTPHPDQQQFYQRRNELWQMREEADSLKGREGMRFRIDHRDELRLFEQAKATATRLEELRKVKDRLEANERLSDKARRTRVERIEEAMERRVDRFNRLYNEALAPELLAE
ncbi:LPD38 domain-containing protein [Vreelandella massiliensis]|uniref:LPD38 domain-containing protein n=1 Tax=Vreelandella massiliensis TaxID=1816686 RepID=UPI00096A2974|nr:LPD38 domain-containing protein [Halomonas massiliensis]